MDVVAHRGASGAPENTLLAFKKAMELQAPWIEFDVRLSRDGAPVVIHDPVVNRVSDGEGKVAELSLKELKGLDLGKGLRIPALKEVILLCGGNVGMQIELKVDAVEEVSDFLEEFRLKGVRVSSFSLDLLEAFHERELAVDTVLLLSEVPEDIWDTVTESGIDWVGVKGPELTKGFLAEAHELGLRVYAYHVNDQELGERLIGWSVDAIGTDHPEWFL